MSCNRYHLWAALDVHAFSKAEAVLRFSAEEDGMWVQWQDYARLKAEVERLKESNECLDKMHDKEMERSAYLCEEFNRTTAWGRGLESDLSHARVEISFLKAEVERLDHQVKYWRIEAEVDNARWLRCLEDLEKLRKDSQP